MAALTKEEIFAAADAIAREGRQPRVADVHKALGRGSYTTITDAMREWRESNKPAAAAAPDVAPEAISGRLTALGNELWALARQTAQDELQKDRDALEEVKSSMYEQQRETAELADALSEDNERMKEKLSELSRELMSKDGKIADLMDKLHESQKGLAALEGARQSVSDHLRSVQEENRTLRELLAEREAEHEAVVQAERQRAAEVMELRETSAKLYPELQAAKDICELTKKAYEDEVQRRKDLETQLDEERQLTRTSERKAAELAGEIKALRAASAGPDKPKAQKQGGEGK